MKNLLNSYVRIRTFMLMTLSLLILTSCGSGSGGSGSGNSLQPNDNTPIPSSQLQSISISSVNQAVHLGTTEQFIATGYYSNGESTDITSQVTWISSGTSKATISNAPGTKGLVTPVAIGETKITATLGEISSPASNLTISSAKLEQIVIDPITTTTHLGINVQFSIIAIYSDKSTQTITSGASWNSSTPAVATINPTNGLATPVATGTTEIEAIFDGLTATTNLTVSSETLPTVSMVTPSNNATGVSTYPSIQLKFSTEVLNVGTSTISIHQGRVDGPTVAIGSITPAANNIYTLKGITLSQDTKYYILLSDGITSASGMSLAPTTFSFTTGANITLVGPGGSQYVAHQEQMLFTNNSGSALTISSITSNAAIAVFVEPVDTCTNKTLQNHSSCSFSVNISQYYSNPTLVTFSMQYTNGNKNSFPIYISYYADR